MNSLLGMPLRPKRHGVGTFYVRMIGGADDLAGMRQHRP
jgi:hypothetical protein